MDLDREKILVIKSKKDPVAFGELYEAYYSQIFGYILKRTADIHATMDITSETFFKALNNIDRFRWKGVSFSSWIYRIASNEITNYYRKKKSGQEIKRELIDSPDTLNESFEDEINKAEIELERHEEFLALHECISKLPEKYQEVIALRFFEEKKIKEIAEIIQKSEGTVKSLLHRGLERLKIFMEELQLSCEDMVVLNGGQSWKKN